MPGSKMKSSLFTRAVRERLKRGMSRTELSGIVGYPVPTVSACEWLGCDGHDTASPDCMDMIAALYGMDTEDLFPISGSAMKRYGIPDFDVIFDDGLLFHDSMSSDCEVREMLEMSFVGYCNFYNWDEYCVGLNRHSRYARNLGISRHARNLGILIDRVVFRKTLSEIGDEHEISNDRVSQVVKKVRDEMPWKLRALFGDDFLRDAREHRMSDWTPIDFDRESMMLTR